MNPRMTIDVKFANGFITEIRFLVKDDYQLSNDWNIDILAVFMLFFFMSKDTGAQRAIRLSDF